MFIHLIPHADVSKNMCHTEFMLIPVSTGMNDVAMYG